MIGWIRDRVTGAARWVLLTVGGGVLIAAGIVMIFTPGPGWGAIALGLWVWAKQFQWARRLLDRLADWLHAHREKLPDFVARRVDEWQRRRAEVRAHAARLAARKAADERAAAERAAAAGRPAPDDHVAEPAADRAEEPAGDEVGEVDDVVDVTRRAGTSAGA